MRFNDGGTFLSFFLGFGVFPPFFFFVSPLFWARRCLVGVGIDNGGEEAKVLLSGVGGDEVYIGDIYKSKLGCWRGVGGESRYGIVRYVCHRGAVYVRQTDSHILGSEWRRERGSGGEGWRGGSRYRKSG